MKKKLIEVRLLILFAIILFLGSLLILESFQRNSSKFTGAAAGGIPGPPGGNPPGGGGGSGGGSGGGATATSTVTSEEEGGGGPTPIVITPVYPLGGDTIKKGVITLLVKGFSGLYPESEMEVTATSDLFGTVKLLNNFERRGSGVYGANVTIGKSVEKGVYAITIRGQKGSIFTERRILITLDLMITFTTSIKSSYLQGERLFFEGDLKYFNGSLAKNISLEVAFLAQDFFFTKNISANEQGKFSGSYPISFAEPEGAWEIRLRAHDKEGNAGETILRTKVSVPEGVVFYTVSILSPSQDAEFKRGSVVPITIEIKDEGRLLEKAKVEFKDPQGDLLPLKEVRPGTYSAEYFLTPDEPLGVWQLSTQALKTVEGVTKAGGRRITLNVLPATIHLVLLQPTSFDFFTGEKIQLKAKASYSDGSPVDKASLSAIIGNEKLTLWETEPGLYESSYLFSAPALAAAGLAALPGEKITTSRLKVSAEDIHGNRAALPPQPITLRFIGGAELTLRLFYYNIIARYWYLFVLGLLLFILITEPLWYTHHLKSSLHRITEAEERNREVQKDVQRKYFKYHILPRDHYDKLTLRYNEEVSRLKERKMALEKRLSKRLFAKKKSKKMRSASPGDKK